MSANQGNLSASQGDVLLYHEPQVSALCAVHCLNTLLQGPYFTEVDLASLASGLDAREREMMEESGVDSADYLRFVAEDSANVAADGNFSIQVLSEALQVWGLRGVPLHAPEVAAAAQEPQLESGFICHLEAHWFAIRKVAGEWYNFNSLYAAPEHLSQFYLSAYLSSLRSSGWSIFVVRGELPRLAAAAAASAEFASGYGRWLSPAEAEAVRARAKLKQPQLAPPPHGGGGVGGGGGVWGGDGRGGAGGESSSGGGGGSGAGPAPFQGRSYSLRGSAGSAGGSSSGAAGASASQGGGLPSSPWQSQQGANGAVLQGELARALAASLAAAESGGLPGRPDAAGLAASRAQSVQPGTISGWGDIAVPAQAAGSAGRGLGDASAAAAAAGGAAAGAGGGTGAGPASPSISGSSSHRGPAEGTAVGGGGGPSRPAGRQSGTSEAGPAEDGPGGSDELGGGGGGGAAEATGSAAPAPAAAATAVAGRTPGPDRPTGGPEGAAAGAAAETLQLALRLPSGERICSRFSPHATLGTLFEFLAARGIPMEQYCVCEAFPGGQVLSGDGTTLKSAGLRDMSTLIVKPR